MPARLTFFQFLDRAREKFGERFQYRYIPAFSLAAIQNIGCPVHGEFQTSGATHIRSKHGCPQCAADCRSDQNAYRSADMKPSWIKRKKQLESLYGSKYEFPVDFHGNVRELVTVECPAHGRFQKHLFVLLKNNRQHQCQTCRHESSKRFKHKATSDDRQRMAKVNRKLANQQRAVSYADALVRFKAVHGDKFQYSESGYRGMSRLLTFNCKKHGEILMSAKEHVKSRHGCPRCAVNNKSKAEEAWLQQLAVPTLQYSVRLDSGKRLVTDGFDRRTNTIYEFLGDFWHGHPSWHEKFDGINDRNKLPFVILFENTEARFNTLYNLGYNICYVWEADIKVGTTQCRIFKGKLEC